MTLIRKTGADLGSKDGGPPLQRVTKRKNIPSIGREREAAHKFWEVRRGSELNLPSLTGVHYVIFLQVRIIFQAPPPLLIIIAKSLN